MSLKFLDMAAVLIAYLFVGHVLRYGTHYPGGAPIPSGVETGVSRIIWKCDVHSCCGHYYSRRCGRAHKSKWIPDHCHHSRRRYVLTNKCHLLVFMWSALKEHLSMSKSPGMPIVFPSISIGYEIYFNYLYSKDLNSIKSTVSIRLPWTTWKEAWQYDKQKKDKRTY